MMLAVSLCKNYNLMASDYIKTKHQSINTSSDAAQHKAGKILFFCVKNTARRHLKDYRWLTNDL